MKLLNYTSLWFLLSLFLILLVWAGSFYFIMLDEIYDSMDDGLENQKLLVIQKVARDEQILERAEFDESNYQVKKISKSVAIAYKDVYKDTLMYMQNEEDFEPVRLLTTAFEHKGQFYELQVITSMVEEDDLIESLLYSLLFLFLGLAASMLILNNLLLKKIWKPFYLQLERLKNFRLDEPRLVQSVPSPIEEFRLLDESLNRLLENNIQIFNDQKQFLENASHELQTPLAICMNKVELLANRPLSEEQLVLAGSIMDNLKRLVRLNRSLLLLSRITNQQFSGEQAIDLNEWVKKAIDEFSDQASYKGIEITLKENGRCRPKMNPDLAHTLIINLLKNALVHNHAKGEVRVIVDEDSLTIVNTGKDESLDEKQIFERFYKKGDSNGSTGLGLAIIRAITDLYGFTVQYHFDQKHTFRIAFD